MTQLQPTRDSRDAARGKPELKLFVNKNDESIAEYHLARCVYAETLASSLPAVEQLCVMIRNANRPIAEIAADENVFESLSKKSSRHKDLLVDSRDCGFLIALRAVRRMKAGLLDDEIFGATRFHRDDAMPDWAASLGSVAEIDGLSFYL